MQPPHSQGFSWPLMHDNVDRADLNAMIAHLAQDDPRLTHGPKVRAFEEAWAQWVGTSDSVMVNSGSSANDLTLQALRHMYGPGEVILPPLGWVSDVAAVLHAGLQPRFVDIDPVTLGVSASALKEAVSDQTRALILIHILGLTAWTEDLANTCRAADLAVIEDVCESHGATFQGKRCGSLGYASNFSFYYAHHLTTVEGGAVCSDDPDLIDTVRMLRSHGLVRESTDRSTRDRYVKSFPDLNADFIFAYASHNNRPTELNGVLGLSQLPRLEENVERRRHNFKRFMAQIDGSKFRNWFDVDTSSNYAFICVLAEPDFTLRDRVENTLRAQGIEFRRGLSGGGSQIRQPYLRAVMPDLDPLDFPNTEHVHHFGWYIGNHPGITDTQIDMLCELLNGIGPAS